MQANTKHLVKVALNLKYMTDKGDNCDSKKLCALNGMYKVDAFDYLK